MSILTIDTSTKNGSLSIWRSLEETVDFVGDASLTHGERLPSDIENILERANIGLCDIELFGVGIGPGSFTGLRVGIATVQALAVAQKRKVVPVPTLDAVAAARMSERVDVSSGASKRELQAEKMCTVIWMDGQRGHVFAGLYKEGPFALGVVRPRCVDGPLVGYPEDVLDVLIRGLGDIDTQVPVEVIGSATSRDQEILSSRLADVSEDVYITGGETALAPVMGRLVASDQYTPIRPDELQPLYVRPPDAVLVRERRGSRR